MQAHSDRILEQVIRKGRFDYATGEYMAIKSPAPNRGRSFVVQYTFHPTDTHMNRCYYGAYTCIECGTILHVACEGVRPICISFNVGTSGTQTFTKQIVCPIRSHAHASQPTFHTPHRNIPEHRTHMVAYSRVVNHGHYVIVYTHFNPVLVSF